MKYRVKEIKEPFYRPLFFPQRKTLFGWKNLGCDSQFVRSVHNHNNNFTEDKQYTLSLNSAFQAIREYESWKKHQNQYVRIHEYKSNHLFFSLMPK